MNRYPYGNQLEDMIKGIEDSGFEITVAELRETAKTMGGYHYCFKEVADFDLPATFPDIYLYGNGIYLQFERKHITNLEYIDTATMGEVGMDLGMVFYKTKITYGKEPLETNYPLTENDWCGASHFIKNACHYEQYPITQKVAVRFLNSGNPAAAGIYGILPPELQKDPEVARGVLRCLYEDSTQVFQALNPNYELNAECQVPACMGEHFLGEFRHLSNKLGLSEHHSPEQLERYAFEWLKRQGDLYIMRQFAKEYERDQNVLNKYDRYALDADMYEVQALEAGQKIQRPRYQKYQEYLKTWDRLQAPGPEQAPQGPKVTR